MGRVGKKLKMIRFKQAMRDIAINKAGSRVFDLVQRSDATPMRSNESDFEFYNRSSRPEFARVRALMEEFAAHYPKDEVGELIARIRSGDNRHFLSATFELTLHETLLRSGFELSVHPTLPNGNRSKPDFLVKDEYGEEFYLEAVLASENNQADPAAEARKGLVYDYLNANPHQYFMVAVDDEGFPTSQPSGKKITKAVHRWLDSLELEGIQAQIDEGDLFSIPPFEWHHEDWVLQLRPIPLKLERRGKSTRLIGIGAGGGGIVDAWSPIRNAIKMKGSKYGELDKPLLVAVNLNAFNLEDIDEMQALYGQEQYVYKIGNVDSEHRMERAPNGAWYGKGGPQHTRVSGAWIFNDLRPSSMAVRRQTIYFNPWAKHPLTNKLCCFPHAIPEGNKMCWNDGISLSTIFHLNEGWPE